jgi:hypothetical protein
MIKMFLDLNKCIILHYNVSYIHTQCLLHSVQSRNEDSNNTD